MFGWLATRSSRLCPQATQNVVSRGIRPTTPQAWLDVLPQLGSVLYLHDTRCAVLAESMPAGLLVAQRAFAPLLDTFWLLTATLITEDGPREWCECLDREGRTRARLHLLPDTDYLAWDKLMVSRTLQHDAAPLACVQPLLPDSANVVNFRVRDIAGLRVLEHHLPPLSPLGQCIATRIAVAESVMLRC